MLLWGNLIEKDDIDDACYLLSKTWLPIYDNIINLNKREANYDNSLILAYSSMQPLHSELCFLAPVNCGGIVGDVIQGDKIIKDVRSSLC